jgi:hypothetical protein
VSVDASWKNGPGRELLPTRDGKVLISRLTPASDRRPRYDVVDRSGRLMKQIVLDLGESILGFGEGTVYTTSRDEYDLLTLRRHRWR